MPKSANNFCVFILTHGRPDKVITYQTLMRMGYGGPLYLVVDNEDAKADDYIAKFGTDKVIVFDKAAAATKFDEFGNFGDRRAIVYARNECFDIARNLGYEYFLELDDDYRSFGYRITDQSVKKHDGSSWLTITKSIGEIIAITFDFFKSVSASSVAFSQGGDWMSGDFYSEPNRHRKCMNTFFCSTSRQFNFVGRINEDVNTYTWFQGMGNLFFTIPLIQVVQKQTQKNKGGMSDIYLSQGTYIKSFYTILCSPSSVKLRIMGYKNRRRIHHSINWDCAVPMLIDERHRKV